MKYRAFIFVLFFGLFATYAALTPAAIAGMGYTSEEMAAGDSILSLIEAGFTGQKLPPVKWSRHGPLQVLLDLPFLAAGAYMVSTDFAMSFEPILLTALIATILFLWLRKMSSPGLSLGLTIAAAFGTMLWPYAYIGLETKQSFSLLLAGYLGLACGPIRSYSRALLFGLSCAVAVGAKSTGLVLFPAIAYVVYAQFRQDWRQRIRYTFAVVLIIGVIFVLSALARNQYWANRGGASNALQGFLIDSPFLYIANVIGMLGSPVKGLFLFAPLLLFSLYAVPTAWRAHRDLTAFALLVLAGLVFSFSFLRFYADEVWGSRYLHSVIAPLVLLIGAGRTCFSFRRDALLLPLSAIGVVISFLGAFYSYGVLHTAATWTSVNTFEDFLGNPNLNHVHFNALLFGVWLKHPATPVAWTPSRRWMYELPADAPAAKTIDLRELAPPQSFLIRFWGVPHPGNVAPVWVLLLLSAIIGPLLLIMACILTLSGRYRTTFAEPDKGNPGKTTKVQSKEVTHMTRRIRVSLFAVALMLLIVIEARNITAHQPKALRLPANQIRDFAHTGRSGVFVYDPSTGQSYTGLSNGNGTYEYRDNMLSPSFDTLRTGDFNGDGKADLAVYNSHTGVAYVGMGKGDGTFSFQPLHWNPGYDIVEAGDLNHDGKTDIVLYNSKIGTLYVEISNGDGTFITQRKLLSAGFTCLRLADFDGNGKADLFVYDSNKGKASLGVGDGGGGFNFNPLSVSPGYSLVDIGDLNGDGRIDLILYNGANGNAATGISDGAGGFKFTPLLFSPGFTSVRMADYTGDGKADVIVYNKNSAVGYFGTGTGTGTFKFKPLFWSPGYDFVIPQDVNGDGKCDIVLYNSTNGTSYTGISNGTGGFDFTHALWRSGKVLLQ